MPASLLLFRGIIFFRYLYLSPLWPLSSAELIVSDFANCTATCPINSRLISYPISPKKTQYER